MLFSCFGIFKSSLSFDKRILIKQCVSNVDEKVHNPLIEKTVNCALVLFVINA